MQSPKQTRIPKTYESPILKKLDPCEAQDLLLRQAKLGDQGAKDILQMVSPQENDAK